MKAFRINEKIRSSLVKLVSGDKGLPVEMKLEDALALAREEGLDLVEVDGKSNPPVCKIMDYGKHLYKVKKAEQKAKKAQIRIETKEIRLTVTTGEHDLFVKEKKAREFIEKQHKVLVSLLMKGRENAHSDLGRAKMEQFAKRLEDVTIFEQSIKHLGPKITMILSPLKK